MTDLEFRVMDELYFVIHYDDLTDACDLASDRLVPVLSDLYRKKWIRILSSPDQEVDPQSLDLENNYSKYFFLASKKGLFAHNTTG